MKRDARAVVRVRAFAKINVTLRVLGARSDGYHELRTTFQSLALHDTLTCRARPGPFHIVCDDEACPPDETNLVWHAAARVWANAGHRGAPRDVAVRITKRIPIAAGLGGGSSDAVAAMRALAALWRLRLTAARTRKIAAAVGADVPFFLEGGTALGVGRGDVLRPLADAPSAWVTLVVPAFGVSTADAYRWFDVSVARPVARPVGRPFQGRDSRGAESPALQRRDPRWAESPALQRRDRRGADAQVGPYDVVLQNDLEAPVAARHLEIARLVKTLWRAGASHAAMSGSGSAVFGLFNRRADASAAARALAGRGRRVFVTRTLDRAGYARLARPMRV